MLAELGLYLLSLPAAPVGFHGNISGAVGLWSRGKRQARAWAPHLAACHEVLLARSATLPRSGSIAILGSGPLFDIPAAQLAETCDRLYLVDHAHLALPRPKNAIRLWRDLSGPGALGFLDDLPDLDWVISINLVSQLARVADDPGGTVRAHLAGLDALRVPVTLLSDTSYETRSPKGNVLESRDLWHGVPVPPAPHRWTWTVAPPGEEGPNARIHTVSAWPDWKGRAQRPRDR